jgi:hypothetical protein
MIKFFAKGFFPQYATVFVLGLALWFPAFMQSPAPPLQNVYWGPFALLLNRVVMVAGTTGTILAFLLTFFTGITVNTMAGNFNLSDKAGTLPLFLFVLLASFTPALTTASPFIIIVWLVILLFLTLFRHDDKEDNIMHSFDAGLITGLLTLFYYPLLLLVFLIWFALISIKGISWRNFVASITGLLFPVFLIYAWLFFTGNESVLFDKISEIPFYRLNTIFNRFTPDNALIISVTILIFISALSIMNKQKDLSIKQRSFLSVTGFYIMLSLILFSFFNSLEITFLLLPPAASVTLYHLFTGSTKTKWINISLWVFIAVVIINSWIKIFDVTQ